MNDEKYNDDLASLNVKIQKMDKKMDEFSAMDKKLNTVIDLLQGNEFNAGSGFIAEIKTLQKKVDDLVKFKDRMTYISLGIAFPTSYGIFQLIAQFIKTVHG